MQEEVTGVEYSREAAALRSACGQEGCPVCTVVLEAMGRAMDQWQYEGFTDAEDREDVLRSRGFCPLHTWQLTKLGIPFQLGVIYRDVLSEILSSLERDEDGAMGAIAPRKRPGLSGWRRKRSRKIAVTQGEAAYEDCPFCHTRAEVQGRLITILLELLRSREMQALLSSSTGLCLPHFAQARALARKSDLALAHSLVQCQQSCLQAVLGELEELVRKHDYRFEGEPRGNEMMSWRRAAELCAGNPGVR
jgi:hypothetical protein